MLSPPDMWAAPRLCSASYKDLGSPPEVGRRFLCHLLSSRRCLSSILSLLSSKPSTTRDFSLEVDAFDLIQSDPVLGNMLLRFPATLLPLLEEAIVQAQREVLQRLTRIQDRQQNEAAPPAALVKGGRGGNGEPMTRVHARLVHLPPHLSCCKPSLSSIQASDVGKIVQISGTVVRASGVQMYESARAYRCKACDRTFVMNADLEQMNNALPVPTVCPNAGGRGGEDGVGGGCKGSKFDVIAGGSVHTDYQEIKIQEPASRLGIGHIPRSILIKLQHDLVDTCQPGDEVFVVGSLISLWRPVAGNLDCDISMALRAHSIRVANADDHATWNGVGTEMDGSSNGAVREELRKEFDHFWRRPSSQASPIAARNFICKAVCPKLYGMFVIKLALLVTLIGGVSESKVQANVGDRGDGSQRKRFVDADQKGDNEPDQFCVTRDKLSEHSTSPLTMDTDAGRGYGCSRIGGSKWSGYGGSVKTRRRDQSHLLLVGDPGTGKSQFLRFAAALCPRSVLTTGVGTTSAGLTAAAVRENGKDFTLEAGALVLADKGVCCIDEFGCIRDEDRTTIHEAMEQQTLSVAKAGIVCKLNCRATIIAVTNPKGGLYENQDTLSKNTGIGTPLLSRFDLIFKLVDTSSAARDGNIATYLLNRAIQGSGYECSKKRDSDETHWSMAKLRGYIASVKDRFQPTLSDDAALLLERHYNRCREADNSTVKTTVRFFESMIRLSQAHARLMYRNIVVLEDAVAVILLMECSASTWGGFNPTFPDYDNILYRDPMKMSIPEDDEADLHFLCFQYKVLTIYNMLDRLTHSQREEARANMHKLTCEDQEVENSTNDSRTAGPSSGFIDQGTGTWAGVENAREKFLTQDHGVGGVGQINGNQISQNQNPSSSVTMIEEKDHYGRSHFSPRLRPSPQCKGLKDDQCDEWSDRLSQSSSVWEAKRSRSGVAGGPSSSDQFEVHDPDAAFVATLEMHATQQQASKSSQQAVAQEKSSVDAVSRQKEGDIRPERRSPHARKRRRRSAD